MTPVDRPYPRTVWVLTPSYHPVSVEVVREIKAWAFADKGASTEAGKIYLNNEMFDTKAEAIADGRRRIEQRQLDLAKKQATIEKHAKALDKAEEVGS